MAERWGAGDEMEKGPRLILSTEQNALFQA